MKNYCSFSPAHTNPHDPFFVEILNALYPNKSAGPDGLFKKVICACETSPSGLYKPPIAKVYHHKPTREYPRPTLIIKSILNENVLPHLSEQTVAQLPLIAQLS